jgi:hypothetical protein
VSALLNRDGNRRFPWHWVPLGPLVERDPPRLFTDLLARIRQKRDGAGFLIDVWVYHFLAVLSTIFSHSLANLSKKIKKLS